MLRHCPVPDSAALERELKFVLPAGRMPFAERWLASACRGDARFGCSDVWTVYYDTPDRASLAEKTNSDYLKTKIRVRWYAPPDGEPSGDAFLEVKRRVGNRREKRRVVLANAAAALAAQPLDDSRWDGLLTGVASREFAPAGAWRPTLMLLYRRLRFIDAISGARVSCDASIRAHALPRRVLAAWRTGALPVGVVEVKDSSGELPAALSPLVRFGARRLSFSKYAAVWRHVHSR